MSLWGDSAIEKLGDCICGLGVQMDKPTKGRIIRNTETNRQLEGPQYKSRESRKNTGSSGRRKPLEDIPLEAWMDNMSLHLVSIIWIVVLVIAIDFVHNLVINFIIVIICTA